jgi:Na+-driven multidrug efflux pump
MARCRCLAPLSSPNSPLTKGSIVVRHVMGTLGPDTLAAGALGANLYFVSLIFGIGLLNAATPMIAREAGRDPFTVCGVRRIVQQGLWSAGCIAIPCWLVLWWSKQLLIAMGQDGALSAAAGTYVLAVVFMAAMSVTMIVAPRLLISAFLDIADPKNAEVINLSVSFLMFAALFQVADGAQVVGCGMLRGLHDARMPMIFALVGYWGIGLPFGALLAFPFGFNGIGIWIGLSTGLIVVACLMVERWRRREALGLLLF